MSDLDLTADTITLLEQLVNIESVSRNEQRIADAVEAALRPLGHLTVSRHGDTVVARTSLGLMPNARRKMRLKCASLEKPQPKAMS